MRRPKRAVATSKRRTLARSAAAPTNGRVPPIPRARPRPVERERRVEAAHSHGPEYLAWYAGLTVMAVLELIEWPVAVVVAAGHVISHRSRNRAIRALAEGIEAGG